jgi:two-component system chemotaxis response regulator CheY
MQSLRILIADDSLIVQKKLRLIFEDLGHTVVDTAKTGAEAVKKYTTNEIDLVSMDITMPDLDGITATRLILEKDSAAKIIIIT